MRSYETTHPWLTFDIQLNKLPAKTWLLLGEVKSKVEHIAAAPLRPDTAAKLHRLYLAKGARGSAAIEGNTLTEEEVLQHIEGHLELSPSKEYLRQETDKIVEACNHIGEEILVKGNATLSREVITEYNRLVLGGLPTPDHVHAGQLRTQAVAVAGARYRGAPAEDCPFLLDRLCDWLNRDFKSSAQDDEIVLGLIKAILAHLYLAWIHPFDDGNGRTARLLEFHILLSAGVPTPAAHLLSNFYNETRSEYYRQLDAASKSGGDVIPFIEYAVRGIVEELRQQIKYVRDQQWDVTWRNYVHEMFKDMKGGASRRRKHLALDLSRGPVSVPAGEIRGVSPRLAEAYALKSKATITRDINALIAMGLIVKTAEGLKANREIVLQFLPRKIVPKP